MPFSSGAHGIQSTNDALTGDAAVAINANFIKLQSSGMFFQGAWSNALNYAIGDVVLESGLLYIAIAANISEAPPNGAFWSQVSQVTCLPESGGTMTGQLIIGNGASVVFNDGAVMAPDGRGNVALTGGNLAVAELIYVGAGGVVSGASIGSDGHAGINFCDEIGNTMKWDAHNGLGLDLGGNELENLSGINFEDDSTQTTAGLPLTGGTMSGNLNMNGNTVTGNLVGNVTGNLTGTASNATTAAALSGNITESQVTGLAASLAALSPLAGSASVTTLGTITTGTWHGTVVAPAYMTSVSTLANSAGTVAVNAALANVFELQITASGWTIANPSNPTDGQKVIWRLIQGGTGNYTISWGTAFNWGTGAAPTLSTAVGKTDYVVGIYNGTTSKWDMVASALTF